MLDDGGEDEDRAIFEAFIALLGQVEEPGGVALSLFCWKGKRRWSVLPRSCRSHSIGLLCLGVCNNNPGGAYMLLLLLPFRLPVLMQWC